ncbi:6980_t:CDS:2, partial [Entrophospora sp. SA101]
MLHSEQTPLINWDGLSSQSTKFRNAEANDMKMYIHAMEQGSGPFRKMIQIFSIELPIVIDNLHSSTDNFINL